LPPCATGRDGRDTRCAFPVRIKFGVCMKYDTIIVGGGIAGLTAAAFLCKDNRRVLLCEKEEQVGGLVGSFTVDGFTFDTGLRAMENSGVLFPMLKSLDLNVEFLPNDVSIGIDKEIVRLQSEDSLQLYRDMLLSCFPDDSKDIDALIAVVRQTMLYMDVLYGIDNPLFMNLKEDRKYLLKTLLPWLLRYVFTIGKIKKLNRPVEEYLEGIIRHPSLRDIIAQHFFRATPAFFALSYFSLYLDYNYPQGGTGSLIRAMETYIVQHNGEIRVKTPVQSVDPSRRRVTAADGTAFDANTIIWAADMKALYAAVDPLDSLPVAAQRAIRKQKESIAGLRGGDSVLTLYVRTDLEPAYFAGIHSPHFFYTPYKTGLSTVPLRDIQTPDGGYITDRARLVAWLREYLRLTTYEISVPVLRDESLAPPGHTGLIISTLLDFSLVRHIEAQGWYEEFKALCQAVMLETLTCTVYPALEGRASDCMMATPLTIERRTGNTEGAITGWSFENPQIPAVSKMTRIAQSVQSPIPHVWQAGQWTYSPSGFPIAILTGKMAADAVSKSLR